MRAAHSPATSSPAPRPVLAEPAPCDDLERILAVDLVGVFLDLAPEIDVVRLGLEIAEAARRREDEAV